MSAVGAKRTWPIAPQMSAFDPKRTSAWLTLNPFQQLTQADTMAVLGYERVDAKARVHCRSWRRDGRVPGHRPCAARCQATDHRISRFQQAASHEWMDCCLCKAAA